MAGKKREGEESQRRKERVGREGRGEGRQGGERDGRQEEADVL